MFTKLGVVIPLGGVGEFDEIVTEMAGPLLLDGRVLLYYTGSDGANDRVGLAASDDGVHFTKLGVVLPLGVGGDFDDEHTRRAAPLLLDGRVLLYYSGHDGSTYRVGLAVSDDGVHFTKLGVVVPLGGGGEFDDARTEGAAPLLLDGRVLLYYSGHDGSTYRVGLAVSDDGVHFTKLGVVVPLGGGGEFDDARTEGAAPLLLDGRVLLYYSGYNATFYRVGLAASDDGVHFTKLGVVVPLGGVGEFDQFSTDSASPLLVDGRVLLYYTGFQSPSYRVGLTVSDDGVHFTKLGVVVPVGAGGEFDDRYTDYPAPLLVDGRVLMYYSGHDGSRYRTGVATSDMGV